jgi:alpha-tubulin suppressor-like RCC1 family protein
MKLSRRISVYLVVLSGLSYQVQATGLSASKVSGGESHTMVLTNTGSTFCCGDNAYKQLGNANAQTYESRLIQVQSVSGSSFLENITQISAGWKHSMALSSDKTVKCWGDGGYGKLGDGYTITSATPVFVLPGEQSSEPGYGSNSYLANIIYIAAGRSGEHSLAADTDGHTWAWGLGDMGQLGDGGSGSTYYQRTPVKVHDTSDNHSGLQNIIAVSAGQSHSMALDSGGHVYTWGSNTYWNSNVHGKLGINDTSSEYKTFPQQVLKGEQDSSSNYLENVVAISAGWDYSLALCNDGSVYAWGHNRGVAECNGYGALGNNTQNNSDVPVRVLAGMQGGGTYLHDIQQISAGDGYSLFLDKDGRVFAVGDNTYGQLGIGIAGANEYRLTPVQVAGGEMGTEYLENIVSIAAGYYHAIAVDAGGNTWIWGWGQYGRLGLGDTDDRHVPHLIQCPPVRKPQIMNLSKDDNKSGNSVAPGDCIVYTITYDPNHVNQANVHLRDILPPELDPNFADPNYAHYDVVSNSYKWDFVSIDSSDPNASVSFTAIVNEKAKPGSTIVNQCEIESDGSYTTFVKNTPVSFWNTGNVIYVNDDAVGHNNGASWDDAYNALSDAMIEDANALRPSKSPIWVAAGIYVPLHELDNSFDLINGVEIYGGFQGCNESTTANRDFYNFKSILAGYAHNHVVQADSNVTSSTILDGFVIQKAYQDGVNSLGSPQIQRSTITNNARYGLNFAGSGSVKTPVVLNSNIYHNDSTGIYASSVNLTVKNSWIQYNGTSESDYGISLVSPVSGTTIRNNTITCNKGYGISCAGGSQSVSNCILWGNTLHDTDQYYGCTVTYSCIDTPGPPGGSTPDANHNIFCLPGFAYLNDDPNTIPDLHLATNSDCKERGYNTDISDETDIDNGTRINNTYVDMGADEVDCNDPNRNRDLNYGEVKSDGVINLKEFALLAHAWGSTSSDPNWIADCDFDESGTIGLGDLYTFTDDNQPADGYWLWEACWRYDGGVGAMMMGDGGGESMMMATEPSLSLEDEIDIFYTAISQVDQIIANISSDPSSQESLEKWLYIRDSLNTILDHVLESQDY